MKETGWALRIEFSLDGVTGICGTPYYPVGRNNSKTMSEKILRITKKKLKTPPRHFFIWFWRTTIPHRGKMYYYFASLFSGNLAHRPPRAETALTRGQHTGTTPGRDRIARRASFASVNDVRSASCTDH